MKATDETRAERIALLRTHLASQTTQLEAMRYEIYRMELAVMRTENTIARLQRRAQPHRLIDP